jgi:hypothetical protein
MSVCYRSNDTTLAAKRLLCFYRSLWIVCRETTFQLFFQSVQVRFLLLGARTAVRYFFALWSGRFWLECSVLFETVSIAVLNSFSQNKVPAINTLNKTFLQGYDHFTTVSKFILRVPTPLPSMYVHQYKSRDSAVGIATSYGPGRPRGRSSSPGRVNNFLFSMSSSPVLGSTQPPIQWVPGLFLRG